jgi:hypothetical protein
VTSDGNYGIKVLETTGVQHYDGDAAYFDIFEDHICAQERQFDEIGLEMKSEDEIGAQPTFL